MKKTLQNTYNYFHTLITYTPTLLYYTYLRSYATHTNVGLASVFKGIIINCGEDKLKIKAFFYFILMRIPKANSRCPWGNKMGLKQLACSLILLPHRQRKFDSSTNLKKYGRSIEFILDNTYLSISLSLPHFMSHF